MSYRPLPMRALLLFVLAATSCSRPILDPWPPAENALIRRTDGLEFELPARWIHSAESSGTVFSGPLGDADYYTTITVQRAPAMALDEAFQELFAKLEGMDSAAIFYVSPVVVGDAPGLLYNLSFGWHDTPRRKIGVLVAARDATIDFAFGSNAELFGGGVPVFDAAFASLRVTGEVLRDF